MVPYLVVAVALSLMVLVAPLRKVNTASWGVALAVLVIFVGLRHHVGMDWNNYIGMIYRASAGGLIESWAHAEPLYAMLLWVAGQMGIGMYGPNLVVAAILLAGLFRYARTTPSPWIAVLVSLPVLIVVTGMSANRQAAAIGILLWAVAGWANYSIGKRVVFIVLAASFHASAIIFLALVVADLRLSRTAKAAALTLFGAATFYYLVATEKAEYYTQIYGFGQTEVTQSSGAVFHVLVNGGPALVYFLMRKHRAVLLPNDVHRNMAVMAVLLIFGALVASAASGRVSLYLFPVSMHVFAAFPGILHSGTTRLMYRMGCIVFFTSLLAFWLLASNTGYAYLPYQNFLIVDPAYYELCCS